MILSFEVTSCWRGRIGNKKQKLAREKGLRKGEGWKAGRIHCVLSFVFIDLYINLLWIARKGEN